MEPKLSPEANHAVHFREFIQRLAQKFEPLQIFSFSQNGYTHYSQGCFNDHQGYFKCDHCLLVVTETATRIDYEMQDFANTYYRHGTITVICHGKHSIVDAVQHNSRFFISVLATGKLLYSKDGLLDGDPIPPFIPTKGAIKALKHYEHRIPLADVFLMCASECLEKNQFGICAFMLHQAVEQACICLVRVHIAYRSEFHNLYRLLRLCQCFSEKPFLLFLSTPEDERLFDALQFKAIKSEIESKTKEYIIGVDETSFKNYLFEKYKLESLAIDLDSEHYDLPQNKRETRTDRFYNEKYEIEVYKFEIEYGFSGSSELFRIHPDRWVMTSTDISVDTSRNIVSFQITIDKQDPELFKSQKSQIFGRAFANLDNANSFVQPFNNSILQFILTTFSNRKAKLNAENDFFAAINIKTNKNTESIFTAPTINKRIIPQPPSMSDKKEFSSQPTMAIEMYHDVLKVIYDSDKGMEKKPSLYHNKDEEGLRDQFLFVLETRYVGTTASGETFNRSGKTDIILKYAPDGSNLFVAECKIWKGASEFSKAITQLFDLYLTWRDSKVALIFFVKNKDFTNVLQSMQAEAKSHPYYVTQKGSRGESSFSYIFNLPQDPNKSIYLEVMAFHYDK